MNLQTRPDPVGCARELRVEIAAAADEIESTRRIPEALLGRLHDSRLTPWFKRLDWLSVA